MRILMINNFYPPCRFGWGYMQLCEEVTDRLAALGHEVEVLTSSRRHGRELARPYAVHRELHIDPDWDSAWPAWVQYLAFSRRRQNRVIAAFRAVTLRFRPDVVLMWHAGGLPAALLGELEFGSRWLPAYYVAGYYPEVDDEYAEYWDSPGQRAGAQALKAGIRSVALKVRPLAPPRIFRYSNVMCVSKYVRDRLVASSRIPDDTVVVHNGVDVVVFNGEVACRPEAFQDGLRILVAGRLAPEKGVHTVIDAGRDVNRERPGSARLSVLGDGPRGYRSELQARVKVADLGGCVEFLPPIEREALPAFMTAFNVQVIASEYAEPLARAMQEAMAMGLLVVGTTTGGSGELLRHGETGLEFTAADSAGLAAQLLVAASDPSRSALLAQTGRSVVRERFTLEMTVRQIEATLSTWLRRFEAE